MKSLVAVAAIAGALATISIPANALPLVSAQVTAGQNANVVDVGWRCGRHRHWSWRWHHCVWNR